MTLWTRLRRRAVGAILRIFGRQTAPVHPLPLVPQRIEPLPLPLERTVTADGRTLTLLGRAAIEPPQSPPGPLATSPGRITPGEALPEARFPAEIYVNAMNRGVARDAQWAHVVIADRSIFDGPPPSPPDSGRVPPPEFLLHAAWLDRDHG